MRSRWSECSATPAPTEIRAGRGPDGRSTAVVAAALTLFLLTQYWLAWTMPFLGDDFVILDRVRGASFWDLWRTGGLPLFGWYRPVSRELHYWSLRSLFGTHEPAFHLTSFALWIAILVLFHRYVHRLAGAGVAAIAVGGAACLSAWGGPLVWIAGAQDLWMLFFSFAYLLAMESGRTLWAAPCLALALLSKESAATFVVVAFAADLCRGGVDRRALMRRYAPSLAVVALWASVHPTLFARMSGHLSPAETATRPDRWWAAGRAALAIFDFDSAPKPENGWRSPLLFWAASCISLLVILAPAWKGEDPESGVPRARLLWLAGTWTVAGIAVALGPSLGWVSYYPIIGLLGAWFAIGLLLGRHRRIAFALVLIMGLLRAARTDTPTWDWGSEWYQLRAGSILRRLRIDLEARHPVLAPHTRAYFTHIPNNVGLIAGSSPVLRVWYGDPTLEAHFLRDYAVRAEGEPPGPDLFFFYDVERGLEELRQAAPDTRRMGLTAEGQARYYNLATMLLDGGNLTGGAREYLAIARGDCARTDCAMFAAAAYQVQGSTSERDEALSTARACGMSEPEIAQRMEDLLTHFPHVRGRAQARR